MTEEVYRNENVKRNLLEMYHIVTVFFKSIIQTHNRYYLCLHFKTEATLVK